MPKQRSVERVEIRALLLQPRDGGEIIRITDVERTAMHSLWVGKWKKLPVFVDTFAMCVIEREESGAYGGIGKVQIPTGHGEGKRYFYFKSWEQEVARDG